MAQEDIGTLHGSIVIEDKGSAIVGKFAKGLGDLKQQALGTALGFIGANGVNQALNTVIDTTKQLIQDHIELMDTMARVQARTGATSGEMQVLGDGVLDLSRKYGRDAGGLAHALDLVTESGVAVSDSLDFLDTVIKGAKIGAMEYGQSIEMIDGICHSFNMTSAAAPTILDKLTVAAKQGEIPLRELGGVLAVVAPMASEAGMSFDELLASIDAMTKGGVKTEQAAMSLKLFLTSMERPTKALAAAMGGESLQAVGSFQKALQNILKYTGGNVDEIGQLIPGARSLSGVLKLGANNGQLFAESLSKIKASADEADKQMIVLGNTTKTKWSQFIEGIKHPFSKYEAGTEWGIYLEEFDAAMSHIQAKKGTVEDFQAAIEELQRRLGMRLSWSMTPLEQAYGKKDLIPTSDSDREKLRQQIKSFTDEVIRLQKESADKIKSEALRNAPSLTPGAKAGKTPLEQQEDTVKKLTVLYETDKNAYVNASVEKIKADLAVVESSSVSAVKDDKIQEELTRKKKTKINELKALLKDRNDQQLKFAKETADAEEQIDKKVIEVRKASIQEQIDMYDEEAAKDTNTQEQRWNAEEAASKKRRELAAIERDEAQADADRKMNLATETFDNQVGFTDEEKKHASEMYDKAREEWEKTSVLIEKIFGVKLDKELRVVADVQVKKNLTLLQDMENNYRKWIDNFTTAPATAWSGVVSDVTGGISEIGQAFGGMNDRWASSITDMGNTIGSLLSGNPIQTAFSGLKLIGDALGLTGDKSKEAAKQQAEAAKKAKEAAEANKEAAYNAKQAADEFFKMIGRDDPYAAAKNELQDKIDNTLKTISDVATNSLGTRTTLEDLGGLETATKAAGVAAGTWLITGPSGAPSTAAALIQKIDVAPTPANVAAGTSFGSNWQRDKAISALGASLGLEALDANTFEAWQANRGKFEDYYARAKARIAALNAVSSYLPVLANYQTELATPMGPNVDPDKNVIYSDYKAALQLQVDKEEITQTQMGQMLLDKLHAEEINPTAFTGALDRISFSREELEAQKMIDGDKKEEDGITPYHAAAGGIAKGRSIVEVAEAGSPELFLPLNQGGSNFLRNLMSTMPGYAGGGGMNLSGMNGKLDINISCDVRGETGSAETVAHAIVEVVGQQLADRVEVIGRARGRF